MGKDLTKLISTEIFKCTERGEKVIVIGVGTRILTHFLQEQPGHMKVKYNRRVIPEGIESSAKVDAMEGHLTSFMADVNNGSVKFTYPSEDALKGPISSGADTIILCPIDIPKIQITNQARFNEKEFVLKDISRLAYFKVSRETKVHKRPFPASGIVACYDYFPLEEMALLFTASCVALVFDMTAYNHVTHENVGKIADRFNMNQGSVLSARFLANHTFTHVKAIEACIEVLVDLGYVKRFFDPKTMQSMYSLVSPPILSEIDDYVREMTSHIALYQDMAHKDQGTLRLRQYLEMKIQEHCLRHKSKAVLFKDDGSFETITSEPGRVADLLQSLP